MVRPSSPLRDARRASFFPIPGGSLLCAAAFLAACGDSPASTGSDASKASDASTADGGTATAADGGSAAEADASQTPDATLDAPSGYVTVLVPNPDGPCVLPTACGGDVTGTWMLVDECNRFPDNNWPQSSTCDFPTGSVQVTVWEAKTLTLSGGSLSGTTQRLEGFVFAIPPTCLSSAPCSQWPGLLQASVDAYSIMATCTDDSAGACTCSEIAPDPALSGSATGTYQVNGTALSSGGSSMPYCVQGSQLTIFDPDGAWVYTYRKQ